MSREKQRWMGCPLVYSSECRRYDFGGGHPLNSTRLELATDLMRELGLLDRCGVVPPRLASEEELGWVHSPEYIAAVRALSERPDHPLLSRLYGFGPGDNPPFAGMHEAAATIVGGALVAAEGIARGAYPRAFHISGGLHHAQRAQASGFCVYNDAAVACEFFRRRGWRVLYVDADAHHGDGTQALFYDTDQVLTVSLHESGRYLFPGTGHPEELGEGQGYGYSVNVPLLPLTDDASWVECFECVVPAVARAFRPDVIVSQHGCDTHHRDPLTDLGCTVYTAEYFARRMHELSHELCGGRWLAMGGGGYDIWATVPRAWALVYGVVSHQEVPEEVPEPWRRRWQPQAPYGLPSCMREQPSEDAPAAVRAHNLETAQRVAERVLAVLKGG